MLSKVLLVLVLWLVVPLAVAEIAVRVWKPGFPGFRLPQVAHEPVDGYGFGLERSQSAYSVDEPVTINSDGFRGPELRDRDEVGLRVLCLGDSFTFGYGVRDEDTYPRQLERLARERWPGREIEVVNTGAQGYATYHEMDLLRDRGLALEPDVVVLAVYHNDLQTRPNGDYADGYREEMEEARDSFHHRMPRLDWALKNSAAITIATQIYRASRRSQDDAMREAAEGEQSDAVWRSMESELASFAELGRENDFIPVVMVIPAHSQVVGSTDGSRYPDEVLRIAAKLGIEAIDLRSSLSSSLESGTPVYLSWDHHFSAAGNLVVAKAALAAVEGRLEP